MIPESWTKTKDCPCCGQRMRYAKLKKRAKFYCDGIAGCGHAELRESDWEIAIRRGQHDRRIGVIKLTVEV